MRLALKELISCKKRIKEVKGHSNSTKIYLFKVNNKNTRKKVWNIFKVNNKTPERRHWRRSGVFIVIFEHISHLFLVFLLLILSKYVLAGNLLRMSLLNLFILQLWNTSKKIHNFWRVSERRIKFLHPCMHSRHLPVYTRNNRNTGKRCKICLKL